MRRSSPPPPVPASLSPLVTSVHAAIEAASNRGGALSVEQLRTVQDALETFYQGFLALPAVDGVRCREGCANCCTQMVFGVHAFEVEVLGRRVREEERASEITTRLEARLAAYDRLRREIDRREDEHPDDWVERVAIAFHALRLPCVFLREDGGCAVHAERPLACRRHFSLSDPELCLAEGVSRAEHLGFQVDCEATIDARLDRVDARIPFEPDTDLLDLALLRWLRVRST